MDTIQDIKHCKFDAEIGKVLQLMIHSLYTNKDIFLRELISNASDACDKLHYETIQQPELLDEEPLKIQVIVNHAEKVLIVQDNGIGMSQEDMIANLGTIASSGTQKFLSQLSGDKQHDVNLIGQFGVGFYSAFMVASLVRVYSTKAGGSKTYVWESNGETEYKTFLAPQPMVTRGTRIELHIKDSEVEYLEKYRLRHIISMYSDHIGFPIELVDEGEATEIVNKSSALWIRPPQTVSAEQYKQFYQDIAHSPDEPWLTLHNKIEGNLEYINLLFIPKHKPFDLFHPDRKARVKLYVRRVFITDEGIDLIPAYMRFLRGVIDSSDLPLNISRQTLQHNLTLAKIKRSIVMRILTALKKKAEQDHSAYQEFWLNFGEVMKEGLCEGALEEKEQLLGVCRFYSTKSAQHLISLDEYIENMPEGQGTIYYITGNNVEALRADPQLQGFAKRNIEVLLLADHVDEFWVNVIQQYKNYELKAVTSAGIDLEKLKKPSNSKDIDKEQPGQWEPLKNYITQTLADKVKGVKISTKLIDSPACLAIPEGAMNIRMESILIEQKQLKKRSAKILEINPEHPLLANIAERLEAQKVDESDTEMLQVIFGEACLIAGEPLENPAQFVTNLNKLLQLQL